MSRVDQRVLIELLYILNVLCFYYYKGISNSLIELRVVALASNHLLEEVVEILVDF